MLGCSVCLGCWFGGCLGCGMLFSLVLAGVFVVLALGIS